MNGAIIETTGLTRRFGKITAVRRLNLRVEPGHVTAFLGPNGAGKTTTLRLLLGLLSPDEGEIQIFGRHLRPNRCEILARIGVLDEKPVLYDHLTARENLAVTRRVLGLPRATGERALAAAGLSDAADRFVREFSLGMRQRLGLARALIAQPDLLILDEPANGLDPSAIQEVRELLSRLAKERGASVLLSSHWLGEVERMASQVIVLDKGALRFQGAMESLLTESAGCLLIGVDRPAPALRFLRAKGFEVQGEPSESRGKRGRGWLELGWLDSEAAASVCAVLVEGGFRVHHLSQERPSLESLFLKLTTEPRGRGE